MEYDEHTDATEDTVAASPWQLRWTAESRYLFWASIESSERRYQTFGRRCGRYLVASLLAWLPPGKTFWHLGAHNTFLCRILLDAGYQVLVSGAELTEPAEDGCQLSQRAGYLGSDDRPAAGTLDAVLIDGVATLDPARLGEYLAQAQQALRDEGALILVAPNREELEYGTALCPNCGALFHQWQHLESYSPDRLETLARLGGFDPVAVLELELSEAALRLQPSSFRRLVSQPDRVVGNGETLVLIARRSLGGTSPPLDGLAAMGTGPDHITEPLPEPVDMHWNAAAIASFWDGINATRLEELGFSRQSGRHLLRVLRPWLSPRARHLDYGAGTGELALQLIAAGYPTSTFEPSAAMRAVQQRRLAPLRGFLGIWTPEQADTFDTVLLCEVIEHLMPADIPTVLQGINQSLPIGGVLIVTTPNEEDLAASTLQCPHCATRFHRWQHLQSYSAASLSALLQGHGFEPIVVHQVELTDAALSANPFLDELTGDKRPLAIGNGATLVYVGRKIAEATGDLAATGVEAKAMLTVEAHQAHTLARIDDVLRHVSDDTKAGGLPVAVLFTQPPNLLLLGRFHEDRRISVLLGPPCSVVSGRGQPFGYVAVDLEAGALPNGFGLPPQLVVAGPTEAVPTRLRLALRAAGVRRLWLADPGDRRRTIGDWIVEGVQHSLRYRLSRPDAYKTVLVSAASHSLRWSRSVANKLVLQRLPAPWQKRIADAGVAWRALREEQQFLRRAARAPALAKVAPLFPRAAFADGPVILVNNALAWGGVERQIVYVLKGLARRQARPPLLRCLRLNAGADYRFFLPDLERERLDVRDIRDSDWSDRVLHNVLEPLQGRTLADVIAIFPPTLQDEIRRFLAEFLDERPAVVHVWQDLASVSAGYAAVLAGVPRIILSGRNLRPTHFAYHQPYMATAYRALAKVPRVTLVNNSEAGARDYADWLKVPRNRFVVKRNGIDPKCFQRASADEIASFRANYDIPVTAPLVGSVFRLYAEKRPLLWIETAALVAREHPDAHFVIFGTGPLLADARSHGDTLGLGARLHLPGTTLEPQVAISAMTCLLLTSCFEGTPNVVLEAGLLGVPVVATDAGGTCEAMATGETGWLVDVATAEALAERVCSVLADTAWQDAARIAGPRFVADRFGLERMISNTLALYGPEFDRTSTGDAFHPSAGANGTPPASGGLG
jgi:glycosyltransferase involved in cell wall biosynthesis/SAM-dependent methyltransferase